MSYNTLPFYIFLIILIPLYALCPQKQKWKLLLLFSCIFYIYSGIDKLILLFLTSLVVYCSGIKMEKIYKEYDIYINSHSITSKERASLLLDYKARCKNILIISFLIILGILVYCKFALRIINTIGTRHEGIFNLGIIVPLGISYYTFSSLGYLLDIYWRKIRPEHNYFKLALCMTYFPQIIQGPISRYNKLLPQFNSPVSMTFQRLSYGLQLMLWGYFKKMVIADRLDIFVKTVNASIENYQGVVILIALLFSTFQLYTDFSGCMDIVTGVSQILGINLDKNFDHPFFSKNTAEFWRRWHITLGSWFKDYVYFPLATSPRLMKISKYIKNHFGIQASKNISVIVPLASVWILTGIWHGTGWNYVLWGIYFGAIIISSNVLGAFFHKMNIRLHIREDRFEWKLFQMIRTFIIFMIGHLIVMPGTLQKTVLTIRQLFASFNIWVLFDKTLFTLGLDQPNFSLAIFCLIFLLVIENLQLKYSLREKISEFNIFFRWGIYYLGIFAILLLGIYGTGYNPGSFVYAQF